MDSLDLCLPKALAELNLLEQYKLNTLVHKWRDVVGDVIADHTKIVSIKPPNMVISADNSMWMQELQMQKRRIIEAINKYYRQEVITDIRFIMKRQSYVKVETNTSLTIPDEQIITKRINFADIVLSKEDVDAIDTSLKQTDNEVLKAAFRKVQITARKREIYLEQHGYHRCKRCGMHMKSKKEICPTCEYELHRAHIKELLESIRTLNTATVSNLYSVVFQTLQKRCGNPYTFTLIRFIKDLSIAVICLWWLCLSPTKSLMS